MKRGSVIIANGDIPSLAENMKKPSIQRKILISQHNNFSDISIKNLRNDAQGGIFDLYLHRVESIIDNIKIPVLQEEDVYAAAFSAAVGFMTGISLNSIKQGVNTYSNVLR